MSLTVINAELVRKLLPMNECIEVMAAAMAATSGGTVDIPPRIHNPLAEGAGAYILMPGSSAALNCYGVKVISLYPENSGRGLPAIQGYISLFDYQSGTPVAIVAGAEITALRTAAASGLATKLLARNNAKTCGIFGTGRLADSHIDAMSAVRGVVEVLVWGRDENKAHAFAQQQAKRTGLEVRAVKNPAEAGGCDLVCTVTGSAEPVLFGEWVCSGAHVNLVGAHALTTREADTNLIVKSAVYVDSLESVRNEGGDVMIPVTEGAVTEAHILGEIGDLESGNIPGRADEDQITLYNSLGITAQDIYAASHVFRAAQALGLGLQVDLDLD